MAPVSPNILQFANKKRPVPLYIRDVEENSQRERHGRFSEALGELGSQVAFSVTNNNLRTELTEIADHADA